jgi:hypothetical protein
MEHESRHFICPGCQQVAEFPLPDDQAPICANGHQQMPMADVKTLFLVLGQQPEPPLSPAWELLIKLQEEVVGPAEPALDYQI